MTGVGRDRIEEPILNIGIVGYGTVGQALKRFFERPRLHRVVVFDKYLPEFRSAEQRNSLAACDIVFVAVPTPYDEALGRCDISAVVEVVDTLSTPMCIKSTIPPGTIDRLTQVTNKRIAFCPEYIGESAAHPYREIDDCGFVILAGDPLTCGLVRRAYESSSTSTLNFIHAETRAAELAKYMENCFLATKVAFANQFYDLACAAGIDYSAVRELFILDARMGQSHTAVTEARGFGGRCLPKDMKSLLAWAEEFSGAPLLQEVLRYNETLTRAREILG
jgi:UDPglucose 6-dehydrogenase